MEWPGTYTYGRPAMAAVRYEIAVRGSVGHSVATALRGFEVARSNPGETTFVGWICDQSALHGAINQIFDLGLELLCVRCSEGATAQKGPFDPPGR
jgi:hypothetical protein